jgi:putative DNA primase/helicase
VLVRLHRARRIYHGKNDGTDNVSIGIYVTEGDNEGIYDVSDVHIEALVREYNDAATTRDVVEVFAWLRSSAPAVSVCDDMNLVAVNNGIYDYEHKMLMGFDPEWVFLTKSHVNFVDDAPNPVIHNDDDGTDWDVESWMNSLSDDPDIVDLLWKLCGAIIRPNVPWNKSAWLYSESGNNGKGTLCRLMRNLCGDGAHASIPISAFSNQFGLEALTHVSAVIVDENDTNTYLDKAAALKSVITGDPVTVDRKFKQAITVTFRGMMVQCVNALPQFKDKSDSAYRRLLLIPMEKRFEGHERKYIKGDYLNRPEVLEYVLYKLLAKTNYYELPVPMACEALLSTYKTFNDPIREFLEDVMGRVAWDLLPWQFLYDMYVGWYARNNGSGKAEKKGNFMIRVRSLLGEYTDWEECDLTRVGTRMDEPEPLIIEYSMVQWMNSSYVGRDLDKKCQPDRLRDRYRGLIRRVQGTVAGVSDDDTENND